MNVFFLMLFSRARSVITIIATFIAIVFIVLTYWYSEHSLFWFSMEVVLLPSVYIIGNYHIEQEIERSYHRQMIILEKSFSEVSRKLYKARSRIQQLEEMHGKTGKVKEKDPL